jgi:hypothetical protein
MATGVSHFMCSSSFVGEVSRPAGGPPLPIFEREPPPLTPEHHESGVMNFLSRACVTIPRT